MHGRTPGAGHAHDHGRLKVVGRMPESGTPWDRAVMIPIEAVWATHSMTVHDELERAHGYDHEEEDGTEHEEGHGRLLGVFSEHDFETLPGVSAVVVKPASFADAYRLRQQQSQRTLSGPDRTSVNLMGVFSGEVLVSLHSLLGGASEAVTITARLTLLTALAATLIMGVLLGELRRPALEQLRVLGAPQRYIMSLVWCIVMTVVAAGTAGGLVLGFIGAEAAAHLLAAETGVAMSPAMGSPELLAAAATLLAGSFCALIPAWLAGRRPIR